MPGAAQSSGMLSKADGLGLAEPLVVGKAGGAAGLLGGGLS